MVLGGFRSFHVLVTTMGIVLVILTWICFLASGGVDY